MEITDVRIFLREDGKMKAFAAVTFDASFVVHNIRVLDGNNGFFVSMPSKKRKDGKYQDVAHPITTEMRQRLEKVIIEKYKQVAAEKAAEAPAPAPSSGDGIAADNTQPGEPVVSESAETSASSDVSGPGLEEQK
ncbi:MAG: septation protein SpoVG [Elusimicrobia bacterium HGW-Elusimicrobia-2]|nr:MAG: septation protein SpoVG [Elusimicrobia bacterium HGW-Elusimicrobia-2]